MEKMELKKNSLNVFMNYYILKFFNQKKNENKEITLDDKNTIIKEKLKKIENIMETLILGNHCIGDLFTNLKEALFECIDILDEMGQLEKYEFLFNRNMNRRNLGEIRVPYSKNNLREDLRKSLANNLTGYDNNKISVIFIYYLNRITKELKNYAITTDLLSKSNLPNMSCEEVEDILNENLINSKSINDFNNQKKKLDNLKNEANNKYSKKNIRDLTLENKIKKLENDIKISESEIEKLYKDFSKGNIDSTDIQRITNKEIDMSNLEGYFELSELINKKVNLSTKNSFENRLSDVSQKISTELEEDRQTNPASSTYEALQKNQKYLKQAKQEMYTNFFEETRKDVLKNISKEYLFDDENINRKNFIELFLQNNFLYRQKNELISSTVKSLLDLKYNKERPKYIGIYGIKPKTDITGWGIMVPEHQRESKDCKTIYSSNNNERMIIAFDIKGFNLPITFHIDKYSLMDFIKPFNIPYFAKTHLPIYKGNKAIEDINISNNLLFPTPKDYQKIVTNLWKDKSINTETKKFLGLLKDLQTGTYTKTDRTEYINMKTLEIVDNNIINNKCNKKSR